jgi:hypothetical protein
LQIPLLPKHLPSLQLENAQTSLGIAHDATSQLTMHDLKLLHDAVLRVNEQHEQTLPTLLMKVHSWNTAHLQLPPNANAANLMT